MSKGSIHGLVTLSLLFHLGCARKPQTTTATAPPVPVQVAKVAKQAMPLLLTAVGTVVSPQVVQVRPRVGGLVVAIHFAEGDLIREGQLLVEIDSAPYQNAVREAEARLARDQALLTKAETDLSRATVLAAKDFITKEQLDQAQANVQQLQASVEADEAAVEQARLQLSYCSITSPITGRAGELLVHRGNLVKANDDKALVTIVQVNPVDVFFTVPETYLIQLRKALSKRVQAEVKVRTDGTEAVQGEVYFLDNRVDPSTGTVALKARFPNEDGLLWPGQFVDVTVHLGEEKGVLVIPSSAVMTVQEGNSVFVVQPDNTVALRPVKLKATVGEVVVVAEGLEEGETVVTDGQLRLVAGAKVEARTL
ncbi:MAG: efflux RND transporter periplasmic adaptor subunit [Thermoanaerobaculaceae bacterium]